MVFFLLHLLTSTFICIPFFSGIQSDNMLVMLMYEQLVPFLERQIKTTSFNDLDKNSIMSLMAKKDVLCTDGCWDVKSVWKKETEEKTTALKYLKYIDWHFKCYHMVTWSHHCIVAWWIATISLIIKCHIWKRCGGLTTACSHLHLFSGSYRVRYVFQPDILGISRFRYANPN